MAWRKRQRGCEKLSRDVASKPDPNGFYIVVIRGDGLEKLAEIASLEDSEVEQLGGGLIAVRTKSRRHALRLALLACRLGVIVVE